MPLSEVRAGMRCQGASVVRGVAVSTFDVEVIDIIVGDAAARAPYILFRAEGPAIDRTGIGQGFSGSPIRCPGADGTPRIAGAISEGIGEFGGKTALATPIESVLGEPVDVPVSARSRPDLVARARPISEPMSFGGLSPRVASAVQSAARRVKRVVYATPAPPPAPRSPPPPWSRAPRWRSASPAATSPRPPSERSATSTETGCGRSVTRSTRPAGAHSSSRTPTSTPSSTTRSGRPRPRRTSTPHPVARSERSPPTASAPSRAASGRARRATR